MKVTLKNFTNDHFTAFVCILTFWYTEYPNFVCRVFIFLKMIVSVLKLTQSSSVTWSDPDLIHSLKNIKKKLLQHKQS